jgi:hypothetical protein
MINYLKVSKLQAFLHGVGSILNLCPTVTMPPEMDRPDGDLETAFDTFDKELMKVADRNRDETRGG